MWFDITEWQKPDVWDLKTAAEKVDELEFLYEKNVALLRLQRDAVDQVIRELEPERVCPGCGTVSPRGQSVLPCNSAGWKGNRHGDV